jgi:Circularly permutated YpsA SLOG family
MPLGFLTEAGPRPEFAELYGALELPTAQYLTRTRRNAFEASATIWFGSLKSAGAIATHRACINYGRSCYDVGDHVKPSAVVHWLGMNGYRSLNVAGNCESNNPGIGEQTEQFLVRVFRLMATG